MFGFLKKEIKLVCFDMDDTLCDSKTSEAPAEAYLIELVTKDIKKMQDEQKRHLKRGTRAAKVAGTTSTCSPFALMKIFNEVKKAHVHVDIVPEGFSRALWLRETLERIDAEYDLGISVNTLMKNVEIYERKYWDYFNKDFKKYPNTVSMLKYLKSKNIKLAMITDSDGKKGIKAERIHNMELEEYFDYMIITDDTGKNKPSIENWQLLLKLSGLKARECMMVGDLPDVDLASPKKLGFWTVWTKESFKSDIHHKFVDYEIDDIQELLLIIDRINAR